MKLSSNITYLDCISDTRMFTWFNICFHLELCR